jgi:RimJ/RimL family protein N-acetyltransferase
MPAPASPQATDVPSRIETERLVLRPWSSEDLEALHEALTESVEHLKPWIPWATPKAPTLEQTEARLGIWLDEFVNGDTFLYAALDRSDSALVGGIGWFPRIGPGALEIGYWMRLSRAGSGFATEATRAMTRAGLRIPGIERLEIHLDPANVSSRRVPEKLGYRLLRIDDEDAPDGGTRTTAVFELTLREVEDA